MPRFEFDADESRVWIDGSSSVHPIRATASGVNGWVEIETIRSGVAARPRMRGEVRIAVDRLESGNPLVDRETRRRIDARRHPEITGTVVSAERIDPGRLRVSGNICFRGEEQLVSDEVTARLDGDDLIIDGEARLDVRDWGLQPPRVALLRVHPEIDVRIHLVGRPAPPAGD